MECVDDANYKIPLLRLLVGSEHITFDFGSNLGMLIAPTRNISMISVLLSSLVAITISLIVIFLAWSLAHRTYSDREKESPFECGFDPMGTARLPFSLRFFLLAVIFLVFDVEIVLLFPVIRKRITGLSAASYLSVLAFILILLIGLFHEWREGSLDWIE